MKRLVAAAAALAASLPFAAPAAGDDAREARRAAADYHALFEIREIEPPARRRADGTGRCRARGVAHILFRGPRSLDTGRPAEIVLLCREGGGDAGAGPPILDLADPLGPTRLIVWLNRFEDLLIAVDWVAPDF